MTECKYLIKRVEKLENELREVLADKPMADVMVAMISLLAEALSLSKDPEISMAAAIQHLTELTEIHCSKPKDGDSLH